MREHPPAAGQGESLCSLGSAGSITWTAGENWSHLADAEAEESITGTERWGRTQGSQALGLKRGKMRSLLEMGAGGDREMR